MKKKGIFKTLYHILLILFALEGFVLTISYFAVKLKLTNDPGTVDKNDRVIAEISDADLKKVSQDSLQLMVTHFKKYHNVIDMLHVLYKYYPQNANLIFNTLAYTKDPDLALKMLQATNIYALDSLPYRNDIQSIKNSEIPNDSTHIYRVAVDWMNINEWKVFKEAVVKDQHLIDSAAATLGIEPRLITTMLVGEQIRLFHSIRETFKTVIAPLKILSVENKFSYGVTGIKEETAMQVERFLKDSTSEFYLGKKFENLLDFQTEDVKEERFQRLINYRNHYYSYLYAAIIIKQVMVQWEKAGYNISKRPELLATLYNLGFHTSKPKPNPRVGGSRIWINEVQYTFGSIAFDFYYSGELLKEFPYKTDL